MSTAIQINTHDIEFTGERQQAVNARELHKLLEVGKDFSTWVKNIVNKHKLENGGDYIKIAVISNNPKKRGGGHNRVDYYFLIKNVRIIIEQHKHNITHKLMDADQMTFELAQDAPRRSMQRLVLPLRVLVACEYSGTVRDAFAARGHDAMSCDILPTDKPGKHYQGDVRDILDDGWDLMIAHPPCTYLSVSGIHWNNRGRGWEETEKALDFVRLLMGANIPRIAVENPVSIISSRIRKPDQIIHPHQFGHDASKATCLWLKNLPKLRPTENVPPRIVNGKPRWANQTGPGGQTRRTADRTNSRPVTTDGS